MGFLEIMGLFCWVALQYSTEMSAFGDMRIMGFSRFLHGAVYNVFKRVGVHAEPDRALGSYRED